MEKHTRSPPELAEISPAASFIVNTYDSGKNSETVNSHDLINLSWHYCNVKLSSFTVADCCECGKHIIEADHLSFKKRKISMRGIYYRVTSKIQQQRFFFAGKKRHPRIVGQGPAMPPIRMNGIYYRKSLHFSFCSHRWRHFLRSRIRPRLQVYRRLQS